MYLCFFLYLLISEIFWFLIENEADCTLVKIFITFCPLLLKLLFMQQLKDPNDMLKYLLLKVLLIEFCRQKNNFPTLTN